MKRFIQWLRHLLRAIFGTQPVQDRSDPQIESRSAPMSLPEDSFDATEVVELAPSALPEPEEGEISSMPPGTLPINSPDFFPEIQSDAPVALQVAPSDLTGMLEALLFVCAAPTASAQFAQALGRPEAEILAGLADLQGLYKQTGRGLRLQERNGRYSLVTAPQAAGVIEAFLNLDLSSHLSAPALEALAIVAYRQPVTKAQVEAVRGVDCGGVLRTLLQRGLIEDVGRLETVGRPILYGVTDFFMQHFGLENMQELPPLPSTDADALWAATELAEE